MLAEVEARGTVGTSTQVFPRSSQARSWWRVYTFALVVLDASAVMAGIAAARSMDRSVVIATGLSLVEVPLPLTLVMGVAGWLCMLTIAGAYDRRWLGSGSEEYRRLADAAVKLLLGVALAGFLLNMRTARAFVVISLVVALALSVVLRYVLRQILHRLRSRGRCARSVLVVGSARSAIELIEHLSGARHSGMQPVAACVPGMRGASLRVNGHIDVPVIAEPERALAAAINCRADAIAISDASLDAPLLRRLAWDLEGTGTELMLAPAVTDVAGPRISVRPVAELPLVHVEEPELKGLCRLVKATLDRLLALALLIVLSPVFAIIALAIRLTSTGPVIFKQVRVGLAGHEFLVWKFRTMTPNAEAVLESLLHLNEHDGPLFKIKGDPRVTSVGRILRRFSLDELPQLWNVLRGEMSLVGPRPPIPSEAERYDDHVRRRLLVKPGLTGLWQISGRAGLPWEEAVRLDLHYVENWSLTMDAMILLRTCLAVVKGHGAY